MKHSLIQDTKKQLSLKKIFQLAFKLYNIDNTEMKNDQCSRYHNGMLIRHQLVLSILNDVYYLATMLKANHHRSR